MTKDGPRHPTPFPSALAQVFRQWLPISHSPTWVEVAKVAFVEAGVIKNKFGPRPFRFELKSDQGVRARLPVGGTPGLDNALVGH